MMEDLTGLGRVAESVAKATDTQLWKEREMSETTLFTVGVLSDTDSSVFYPCVNNPTTLKDAIEGAKCHFQQTHPHGGDVDFEVYTSESGDAAIVEVRGSGRNSRAFYKIVRAMAPT